MTELSMLSCVMSFSSKEQGWSLLWQCSTPQGLFCVHQHVQLCSGECSGKGGRDSQSKHWRNEEPRKRAIEMRPVSSVQTLETEEWNHRGDKSGNHFHACVLWQTNTGRIVWFCIHVRLAKSHPLMCKTTNHSLFLFIWNGYNWNGFHICRKCCAT